MEKLVLTIVANTDFMGYLKIATTLLLDLINYPAIDQPFSVLVHVGIEPVDIVDFARLRGELPPAGGTNSADKIQGMVQINDVLPYPDGLVDQETLLSLWSEKKADAVGAGFASDSVGIMLFAMGDFSTTVTVPVPVHISSLFVDIARNSPPFQVLMANMMSRTQMMDIATCIEFAILEYSSLHPSKLILFTADI